MLVVVVDACGNRVGGHTGGCAGRDGMNGICIGGDDNLVLVLTLMLLAVVWISPRHES